MATITFEGYMGSTPDWTNIDTNTIVFSSSLTDLTAPITVDAYADGTHAGTDDPGTDACGTNHMNNCKYLGASLIDINGGGSEALNDTNLTATECTLRVHFNHSTSVDVTNPKFYCYDGSTTTTPATGVDVYGFEQGESYTSWTHINDDSGAIGGNNAGERLDLADSSSAATDHYWYIAVSAAPESVGAKTSFDFGVTLTYS